MYDGWVTRRRKARRSRLDQFGAADLGTRVDELTAGHQRLQAERDDALTQVTT
ncbi:hypothetical protein ACWEJP_27620 [Streptomyces sp. NPDC004749]